MSLNIKALLDLFRNTNTSYKFLYFYAIIRIIKKDPLKKSISFKEIINEMLVLAWLPCFQFDLHFRKQDQIKVILKNLTINSKPSLKNNKPTNKIINELRHLIDEALKNDLTLKTLENNLLRYVMVRLVRPFYKRLKKVKESGKVSMFNMSKKILEDDYTIERPPYLIDYTKSKIILNNNWVQYINDHFHFLELWVLDEWHKYMQYQNKNTPSLYEKLKFPELKRNSLDKQRKFWKELILNNDGQIKCIFSNTILTVNNFDVDHFICWNFLAHDQEWNLIPILSRVNELKNNKIPDKELIKPFINFKIKSFKFAKEILTNKKYEEYLAEHSNFINCSSTDCFNPNYKLKYSEEIILLRNKAKNQGFESFEYLPWETILEN